MQARGGSELGALGRLRQIRRGALRQPDRKRGPLSLAARDPDFAAHRSDDLLHDPETETETAEMPFRYGSFEALENAALVLVGNTDSMIADPKNGRAPIRSELDLDRLSSP